MLRSMTRNAEDREIREQPGGELASRVDRQGEQGVRQGNREKGTETVRADAARRIADAVPVAGRRNR